jgi:iron complex outermembrane recepter protein
VLPTTSSGIYGGSATGGVVNVVLRRDYSGADVKLTYDNSFETDSAIRKFELGAGFNFEGGRTNLLVMASYSDANSLSQGDRDFYSRGVARVLANNPTAFSAATTPILGATPNIRSTNGSNLTLKTGAALNSPITFVPYGYTGIASDEGAALVANAGRFNLDLANTSNSPSGRRWSILSASESAAVGATLRRQFSPWLNAYVDAAFTNSRQRDTGAFGSSISLPASSVANPFNQAITVRAPVLDGDNPGFYFNQNWRVAGGVILKLPGEWMAAADFTWNKARVSQRQPNAVQLTPAGLAAVQAGNPHILRDPAVSPYLLSSQLELFQIFWPFDSVLYDGTVRVSGPVYQLPGGPVKVSASSEYRREVYPESYFNNMNRLVTYPKRSQEIVSGYIETYIPVVGEANRRAFIHELGVQLALRHDDYLIRGNNIRSDPTVPLVSVDTENRSTNPTIAVKYSPAEGIFARASYGLGFLPPNVSQLAPSRQTFVNNTLIDPRRGNEIFGQYDFISSGNPALQPEESESWSGGVVIAPPRLDGFRLSVDYTRITKTNNITSIASQLLLNNESLFPDRVGRAPVTPGDPFGVGRIIWIDASAQNISSARLEAYDVALDYSFELAGQDRVAFFAAATYTPTYLTQIIATLPETDNVGKAGTFNSTTNPGLTLKWKANAGVTFNRGPWTFGWNARYFDSYYVADPVVVTNATVLRNQGGSGRVKSQHYHDVFVRYQFERGWLYGCEAHVGVRNVFRTEPPFDASNTSSYYSYFGDPRIGSYYVSLRRSF